MVGKYVPFGTLMTLYNSLIQHLFDHCGPVWNNLDVTQNDRLQKPQNRAARVISKSPFEMRSKEILTNWGWDNTAIRRSKQILVMMHKIMHNRAPNYLIDKFSRVMDTTHYNLRNNDINLNFPNPKFEYFTKSFIYQGVKASNSLSSDERNIYSLRSFRNNINVSPQLCSGNIYGGQGGDLPRRTFLSENLSLLENLREDTLLYFVF